MGWATGVLLYMIRRMLVLVDKIVDVPLRVVGKSGIALVGEQQKRIVIINAER